MLRLVRFSDTPWTLRFITGWLQGVPFPNSKKNYVGPKFIILYFWKKRDRLFYWTEVVEKYWIFFIFSFFCCLLFFDFFMIYFTGLSLNCFNWILLLQRNWSKLYCMDWAFTVVSLSVRLYCESVSNSFSFVLILAKEERKALEQQVIVMLFIYLSICLVC